MLWMAVTADRCEMRAIVGGKDAKNGGTKEMPVLWWRSDTI